jgi:phage gp29-like protein
VNTVFELPPGWDVKIIESNGRGWESFKDTIEWAEREYMIGIAGQVMTTNGGEGFSNGDIGKSIRADLIEARADALSYTLNTQGIPQYVVDNFGEDALEESACVEWDTTPPRDLAAEAQSTLTAAQALEQTNKALAPYGKRIDVDEWAHRYALKLSDGAVVVQSTASTKEAA